MEAKTMPSPGVSFVSDPRPLVAPLKQVAIKESIFWRRSLWEKAGGELTAAYRDVGDFDLGVRFFRHARLYSVDALIGG
jgi:hypothetical protein